MVQHLNQSIVLIRDCCIEDRYQAIGRSRKQGVLLCWVESDLSDCVGMTLGICLQWLGSVPCVPGNISTNASWSCRATATYHKSTLTSPKPSLVLSVPAAINVSWHANAEIPAPRATDTNHQNKIHHKNLGSTEDMRKRKNLRSAICTPADFALSSQHLTVPSLPAVTNPLPSEVAFRHVMPWCALATVCTSERLVGSK